MQGSNRFAMSWRSVRRRALPLLGGVVVSLVVVAPASATLRVENFNDPVGDQTAMSYSITGGNLAAPVVFSMPLGEGIHANESSIGPPTGTYVIQSTPAAGWRVADIQCFSNNPSPNVFTVDVPNARVTVNHSGTADDTCAFTNRRIGAAATGSAGKSAPGIAPTPPASETAGVALPKAAAVLRVRTGRRFASGTVRVSRQSVIKGQLLRGNRVVGSVRLVRSAGTHVVRVTISQSARRALARLNQPVKLTLRISVSPVGGKAAQVFRFGVRVRAR
jgi:hypothetical protein